MGALKIQSYIDFQKQQYFESSPGDTATSTRSGYFNISVYFLFQMSHLSCTRATSDLSPAGTTEKTTKLQQLQSNVSMPIAAVLGQDKRFALYLDRFTGYRNASSPNKSPKPLISTHPSCPQKNKIHPLQVHKSKYSVT